MAKPLEIAIGGGILIAAAVLLMKQRRESFAKDTANLRMRIAGVSVDDGHFTVNVKIQNPNSTDMEVKSYIGDLFANGKKIGEVKMFGDYIARGNSEIQIPLIAQPVSKLKNFFSAMTKIFSTRGLSAELVGMINVNNHTLPARMSYSL